MPVYKYIVKVLWKYKWLFLIMLSLPVILAIAYCLKATPLYESKMEIYPFCASNEGDTLVSTSIDTLEIDTLIYEPTPKSIFQLNNSLLFNGLIKEERRFPIFPNRFFYLRPDTLVYSGTKSSANVMEAQIYSDFVTSIPTNSKIDTVVYTMNKTIVNKTKFTPYYQVNRIVKCNNFRNLLIDSKISPSLTSQNYDQRIDFHETPDYTFSIAIRAETPQIADSLVMRFFNLLYASVTNLTSYKVASSPTICDEISWDYYYDQVNNSKQQASDSLSDYFLFDILDGPSCSESPVYPYNIFKTLVFVLVIASILSIACICIVEEIRQRIKKADKASK